MLEKWEKSFEHPLVENFAHFEHSAKNTAKNDAGLLL